VTGTSTRYWSLGGAKPSDAPSRALATRIRPTGVADSYQFLPEGGEAQTMSSGITVSPSRAGPAAGAGAASTAQAPPAGVARAVATGSAPGSGVVANALLAPATSNTRVRITTGRLTRACL
jgi:hypothetical protein